MMATISSAALCGISAFPVVVEVDIGLGLPGFGLVGLPDSAVKEARERVFPALKNSGFTIPSRKITVNLAPADKRKEGSALDLPIALGLLVASEQVSLPDLEGIVFAGELALDGSLRPVKGALSLALHARSRRARALVLPAANAEEVEFLPGLRILKAGKLSLLVRLLQEGLLEGGEGGISVGTREIRGGIDLPAPSGPDFREVQGQLSARRALEIAAAGNHNLLLIGSPGCGKSMMARRLPSILPPLTLEESLEASQVHGVAGLLRGRGLLSERPFRAPHHSVSAQALIGGGAHPRPGEISLAHHGVLFLDELPEFSRPVLETLRQPLEEGAITIGRVNQSVRFPARFLLVAAMNPCPCGYLGHGRITCTCRPEEVFRYRQRISGPLLDRIDLHLEVPHVDLKTWEMGPEPEASAAIRARVLEARKRRGGTAGSSLVRTGHEDSAGAGEGPYPASSSDEAARESLLHPEASSLLLRAADRMGFSARAFTRTRKVARTIADLAGERRVGPLHIAEALHFRVLDRRFGGLRSPLEKVMEG